MSALRCDAHCIYLCPIIRRDARIVTTHVEIFACCTGNRRYGRCRMDDARFGERLFFFGLVLCTSCWNTKHVIAPRNVTPARGHFTGVDFLASLYVPSPGPSIRMPILPLYKGRRGLGESKGAQECGKLCIALRNVTLARGDAPRHRSGETRQKKEFLDVNISLY